MSGNIDTREFSINDYDAVDELWQRVEGLEIAESDDRESVPQFLARNPGLSRVATDGPATPPKNDAQSSCVYIHPWLKC